MQTDYGHLTYCTNIHAGESWPEHFSALQQHIPEIKSRISPGKALGIGLRLSNIASLQLSEQRELQLFRQWLQETDTYVFTMNGFPYGGFHHTKVKDHVHSPDWTTNDRVEYTIRLFDILSELLPENMDGGVSTSPLSYRHWFNSVEETALAKETATANILRVVKHLAHISKTTGRLLHLDIEPEPDGMLETGMEFIQWYNHHLVPACKAEFTSLGANSGEDAVKTLREHVRLCYDVCHFAVGYEPHAATIQKLADNKIKIGKIQISAALKAAISEDRQSRLVVTAEFSKFNESTYLHQVVARKNDGELLRYRDLPQALEDAGNPLVKEWRAHFHVPVFEHRFGVLESTQSDICELLGIHKKQLLTPHLEVETYTWEVLQESLRLPLRESIIREMEWVIKQLS